MSGAFIIGRGLTCCCRGYGTRSKFQTRVGTNYVKRVDFGIMTTLEHSPNFTAPLARRLFSNIHTCTALVLYTQNGVAYKLLTP